MAAASMAGIRVERGYATYVASTLHHEEDLEEYDPDTGYTHTSSVVDKKVCVPFIVIVT